MSLPVVSEESFAAEVLEAEGPVLVDFWAEWCGPCRIVHPILEQMASERADVKIVSIDADESPHLSRDYAVMSIPSMLLFDSGEEIGRVIGAMPKPRLESEIDRLLDARS